MMIIVITNQNKLSHIIQRRRQATVHLPFMYCRILAGGPCCTMAGRVAVWFASNWRSWFRLIWSTFVTSRGLGSPRNELRTGASVAANSALLRFTFRLPSATLCSTSKICFLSGWSSFCIRWMCSSETKSRAMVTFEVHLRLNLLSTTDPAKPPCFSMCAWKPGSEVRMKERCKEPELLEAQ